MNDAQPIVMQATDSHDLFDSSKQKEKNTLRNKVILKIGIRKSDQDSDNISVDFQDLVIFL